MKRIRRRNEPIPDLAAYLANAGADASWSGYRGHRAGVDRYRRLIDELERLQHGLCGYCEIDLQEGDREVEHVAPRSRAPTLELEAGNVIACCRGGSSDRPEVRRHEARFSPPGASCGHAKGSSADPDFIDPRELPDLPSVTRVRPSGRLEADKAACAQLKRPAEAVEKTIAILGLNVERLRRARRRHLHNLEKETKALGSDPAAIDAWAREYLLPRGGRLEKYFTTSRSFFGALAERILQEAPRDWI